VEKGVSWIILSFNGFPFTLKGRRACQGLIVGFNTGDLIKGNLFRIEGH
jgi:hypothetical protein